MSLGDLDELVTSCRTEEARRYVSEAVACYKAGSFRACIVATWIAVVYDLLDKVKELALGGDTEARKITDELTALQPRVDSDDQAAIRRILEIERSLVDIANDKFAFFDGQQLTDLKRLHDDRNRCAHPTYQGIDQPYLPSAELARTHLVHAVRHVLATAPVRGKAATVHIVRLVESKLFPIDPVQAKVQLRSGGLERPKDSLVRSVVDHLTFELFEGGALKAQLRTIVALRATYELFPGLCEPRIRKHINALGRRVRDEEFIIFFGLQKQLPQTWDFLEIDNKTRLTALVTQASEDYANGILPVSLEISALQEASRERVLALSAEKLGLLIQKTKHPIIVARAVDIYCSSKSWAEANSHYYYVVEPLLKELDRAQIRRILVAHIQEKADLNGAHSFTKFVQYLYDQERLPHDEIISTMKSNNMEWLLPRVQAKPDSEGIDF